MEINGVFILAVILVVIAFLFASQGIKVVPQQSAWVVERLGKFHAVLNPGLNFIIPFIDRVAYRHSLKEIPLLYYARQHAALCGRGALFPGDGSTARKLWDLELCGRYHAVGTDHLA